MTVYSGTWGGTALSTNDWKAYVSTTMIASADIGTPQPFPRIPGYMTFSLTNETTTHSWSFDILGGVNSVTGGYINPIVTAYPPGQDDQRGAYRYIDGSQVGTTAITSTRVYPVTTINVTDDDGYIWQLIFSQFSGVMPTIQLISGSATNITINITYIRIKESL